MSSEKSDHDGYIAVSAREKKVCGSRSPEQRALHSDSPNRKIVESENAQLAAARTTSTSENPCEKVEPSESPSIFDIRKPSFLFCVHGSTCKGCGHAAPHAPTCTDSTANQQSMMYPTTSSAIKARKRRRKRAPHMKLVNSTVFSVSFKNRSKHQQTPKLLITDQCPHPEFEQESESSSSSSDSSVEQSPQPTRPRRKSRKSKQLLDNKKNPPKVRRPSLDTVENDPLSLTSSVPMRCGESKLLTFNDVTSDDVASKPLKAINFRLSSLFSIPAALTPGVARAELRCAVKAPLLPVQRSGWTKGDDVTMTKQRRQREKWRAMTLDMFCMGGF